MKHSQVAYLTLTALLIAACGGSGNGDMTTDKGQTQSPPSQNSQPKNDQTPDTNKNPDNPHVKLYKINGNYINIDKTQKNKASRFYIFHPQGTLDWFFNNGNPHYLNNQQSSSETFVTVNHKSADKDETVIASNHMSYARYGIIQDNLNKQSYTFAQGISTPSDKVPTEKGAYYKGHVIHSEIGSNVSTIGTSIFAIDFGRKKVTGKLTVNSMEIPLEANLKHDATFSGRNSAGTAVQGNLFGSRAEELGGTYLNIEEGFNGAFGASKTSK